MAVARQPFRPKSRPGRGKALARLTRPYEAITLPRHAMFL
jgi:hypothetical protein